jgi:acyl-homoserine-lactone acylase
MATRLIINAIPGARVYSRHMVRPRRGLVAVALAAVVAVVVPSAAPAPAPELWKQVEIIRTAHGVPHIRAENLRAAGYALAWVMSEDYGSRTGIRLLMSRGELSRFDGRARLDSDFENLQARARAIETYHLLDQETRDIYDGFAIGVNRFVASNPSKFPTGMPADFSGYDVATLHMGDGPPAARVARFLTAINATPPSIESEPDRSEDGSNAWALAPSRTKSGRAILLRNPHLAWNAGYYEAHVTVPGVVDFHGDFRIGGPLVVIGGFNRYLGWATTNSNSGDMTEFYVLDRDSAEAFRWAIEETTRRHGRWDVAWGDVHRVRRGSVDVPVGGCSGVMGCFRALTFARDADGKLSANSGDGWVLAVEFDDVPRAYSVLAYGQSPDPESPWHADQAEMFARGEMKRVAFTGRAVDATAVTRYRPGEPR